MRRPIQTRIFNLPASPPSWRTQELKTPVCAILNPRTCFTTNLINLSSAASASEEEHFSDASEGHVNEQLSPQSSCASPVPRTRVERVDSSAQHGEVPGTSAYEIREQDAVPDEIEVIREGDPSGDRSSAGLQDRPSTPVPRTMVEKLDTDSPSYGEAPGTEAFEKRQADAVPDLVKKTNDPDDSQPPSSANHASPQTDSPNQSIPETKLTRVDSIPTAENLPSQPRAHRRSPSDAMPDVVETVPDTAIPEMPLSHEDAEQEDGDHDGGDEFDEFVEEQDDMGDDDFGDFDDGFQDPGDEVAEAPTTGSITPQQPLAAPSVVRIPIYLNPMKSLTLAAPTHRFRHLQIHLRTPLRPPGHPR